jgi:hypothetical protein
MSKKTYDIINGYGGKLVGSKKTKVLVAEALQLLPPDMVKDLIQHCWVLSSFPDAWAYVFNGNDVTGQHFIFLSEELLKQDKDQIQYTILHEVGHVILRHHNSINYRQTKWEIGKQEREADFFAKQYLVKN